MNKNHFSIQQEILPNHVKYSLPAYLELVGLDVAAAVRVVLAPDLRQNIEHQVGQSVGQVGGLRWLEASTAAARSL